MRQTWLVFCLLFTHLSFGQTFKLQKSTNRADYSLCQENHRIILNKHEIQADSQIARLIKGIYIETLDRTPEDKISSYRELLSHLLIKKIFLSELTKQLNSRPMALPNQPERPSGIKFLNPDAITIDLSSHYSQTLKNIVNARNIKIGKGFLEGLLVDILKDSAKTLVSSRFRQIGAGLMARIVLSSGKIATGQVLKTATIHFGSKVFVSVGTGLLLDIITFPLHAYRLPPETEWTDLLEDYPETIVVPEWMNKAGIKDAPWLAHCCAIQRRTKWMERSLKESLQNDEAEFTHHVRAIWEEKTQIQDQLDPRFNRYQVARDNTYVKPVIVPQEVLGPEWLKSK